MRIARPSASVDQALESGRPGDWLSPGRFAVLLSLLLIASFPRVIIGLATFAHSDYGQFAYPVGFYFREAFWRGEVPFWNPLNECGMPFLAQWNTLTLYPLSLVYLVFPLPWSLGVFDLLHLWLAGLGMYFLARAWTGSGSAAALAGTVFAFNEWPEGRRVGSIHYIPPRNNTAIRQPTVSLRGILDMLTATASQFCLDNRAINFYINRAVSSIHSGPKCNERY